MGKVVYLWYFPGKAEERLLIDFGWMRLHIPKDVSANVLWQKIWGDGNNWRIKSKLFWCSLGMRRTWSLVLRRNGTVGAPLSVPQVPGIYERQTLNRQRLRYSGEMEKLLFHLMTLKGKERKQIRFQRLLLETTTFLDLFSHSRKNDLFYIMSIYLHFSQTHTDLFKNANGREVPFGQQWQNQCRRNRVSPARQDVIGL